MTEKENNNPAKKNITIIDPATRGFCRKPQKPGFIDAICEVCERVFETDEDVYICPECKKKS